MSDVTTQEDTPADDFGAGVEDGEISTVSVVDMLPTFSDVTTADQLGAEAQAWLASQQELVAPDVFAAMQETVDPLTDAVNDGIVPASQARYFFFWLAYNAGVTLIPAAGIYAFVQGYVLKWAQGNGWATLGPNPVPTPAVQAMIESANAAQPLPGAQTAAPTLPTPSRGQQSATTAAGQGTKVTVSGGSPDSVTPQEATDALATTFVESMQVLARVIDAMLPGMAPGQVPEALSELNTAVNALENQMQQVRNGVWPRGYQGALQALNGGLEALHGLAQEVNELHEQMAEKADSSLEDNIKAVGTQTDTNTSAIDTINNVSIPEIAAGLTGLTSTVGALQSQVNDDIVPELNATRAEADATTEELSGTDKDCLDELCDAINNVTDPIEEGGANPSLLKKLGGLLGAIYGVGALLSALEALEVLIDAPAIVTAVVQDTQTMSTWATQAAAVIESDFSWSGGLDVSIPAKS